MYIYTYLYTYIYINIFTYLYHGYLRNLLIQYKVFKAFMYMLHKYFELLCSLLTPLGWVYVIYVAHID
jgi:hypothetical protein